jgi:hypothetical protein
MFHAPWNFLRHAITQETSRSESSRHRKLLTYRRALASYVEHLPLASSYSCNNVPSMSIDCRPSLKNAPLCRLNHCRKLEEFKLEGCAKSMVGVVEGNVHCAAFCGKSGVEFCCVAGPPSNLGACVCCLHACNKGKRNDYFRDVHVDWLIIR